MPNNENENLKGEDDSPSAAAGSATKNCDHIVAIIYSDHEGGEIRTAKDLEESNYDDIEKFKFCPNCGEEL